MRIVLGVGGGIAAYKVASLLRLFTEAGHDVTVIPTEAATRFVGVATWEALSGHPVSNSVFDEVHTVNHVRLGHEAELIVVGTHRTGYFRGRAFGSRSLQLAATSSTPVAKSAFQSVAWSAGRFTSAPEAVTIGPPIPSRSATARTSR